MEIVKSLVCCLIPGLQRRYLEEQEKKIRTERRRELLKQICQTRMSKNYRLRRGRIVDTIVFDYFRIVIVWVQTKVGDVPRDEIVENLKLCGPVASIQDRWSVDEHGRKAWSGALVEFLKSRDAQKAAAELTLKLQHVRFTLLQTVIDTLADCELLHPDRREETTKVVISRTAPLRLEEVEDLRRKVSAYGPVQTFFVNNRQTTIGTFCEVTYSHLTQAYLAAIMTNCHLYNNRGLLTSSIDKTWKDAKIVADAKDCIELLFQSCFPS